MQFNLNYKNPKHRIRNGFIPTFKICLLFLFAFSDNVTFFRKNNFTNYHDKIFFLYKTILIKNLEHNYKFT